MTTFTWVAVALAVIGGAVMIGLQIRTIVRDKRNLKSWERGEDFKGNYWD